MADSETPAAATEPVAAPAATEPEQAPQPPPQAVAPEPKKPEPKTQAEQKPSAAARYQQMNDEDDDEDVDQVKLKAEAPMKPDIKLPYAQTGLYTKVQSKALWPYESAYPSHKSGPKDVGESYNWDENRQGYNILTNASAGRTTSSVYIHGMSEKYVRMIAGKDTILTSARTMNNEGLNRKNPTSDEIRSDAATKIQRAWKAYRARKTFKETTAQAQTAGLGDAPKTTYDCGWNGKSKAPYSQYKHLKGFKHNTILF